MVLSTFSPPADLSHFCLEGTIILHCFKGHPSLPNPDAQRRDALCAEVALGFFPLKTAQHRPPQKTVQLVAARQTKTNQKMRGFQFQGNGWIRPRPSPATSRPHVLTTTNCNRQCNGNWMLLLERGHPGTARSWWTQIP